MGAAIAEDLGQQLGAAVGHQVLLGEVGRAVDQAHHLDDAADLVQVADGGVQGAQQVDGDGAGGGLAGGGVDIAAQLAGPDLALALGDMAGDEDQIAGAHEGHVGGSRHGQRRQGDAQGVEGVVDGGAAHECRGACGSAARWESLRSSYTVSRGERPCRAKPKPCAGPCRPWPGCSGSVVLLRTARHQLLYDSGPQYAPGVDAGQRVLLPLLRALGVERLDLLPMYSALI
eukprot:Opistho-2@11896